MNDSELLRYWDNVLAGLDEALDKLSGDQLAFTAHAGVW